MPLLHGHIRRPQKQGVGVADNNSGKGLHASENHNHPHGTEAAAGGAGPEGVVGVDKRA